MDKKERLIIEYTPMATAIAAKIYKRAPAALEFKELQSLAFLGLTQAATRWEEYCIEQGYDSNAENYFGNYAQRRIRGAVMDSLRVEDRLSREARRIVKALNEAGLDSKASIREMMEATGFSEKKITTALVDLDNKPVYLDVVYDSGYGYDVQSRDNIESSAVVTDILSVLVSTLRTFDKLTQVILALHYYEELELQEIAKRLGSTEAVIGKLHTEAILTVRAALRSAV